MAQQYILHSVGQVARLFLLVAMLMSVATLSWAQQFVDPSATDPDYNARKQATRRSQPQLRENTGDANAVTLPACFEPFNNTGGDGWTALPRNDDGFVGPIALNFDFSLFGTVYNSVFINNNGNVTFNNGVSQYSPDGFPTSTPMVAAFWGDVDTRNESSGRVWYKVYADRLVVTWDRVGFFDSRVDKINTFQLIIRANTAPGFSGNDVTYAYDDMQWTTGEASSGVNGFGGSPSTVGLNRGNNVDFIQTGRFDKNGGDAPTLSATGGIDWLDGRCLSYRALGTAGNLPPEVTGLPSGNQIVLNQGQSQTVTLGFAGPETNQTVTVTSALGGLCNATANVTGNGTQNPTLTFVATGGTCNVGTNAVVFTAADSGTPTAGVSSFTINVVVNPPGTTTVVNQPPVAPSIPNQVGTVGVSYFQAIPAFTDPNAGQILSYSAVGLPANLAFSGGSGGIVAGTPSLSGVFSVTITATDQPNATVSGGLSANAVYTITISPASSTTTTPSVEGTLQLIAPTYNCATGAFRFNTTGGDGSTIIYWAVGITAPTPNVNEDVDAQLAQDIRDDKPNVVPLTLYARQSGLTVTYAWDARAACRSTIPPPTTVCGSPTSTIGQPFALVAPTYSCATGAIQFNTTGGNGSPIEFMAIGITGWTTNCIDNLDPGNTDNNTYTIMARQNGVIVSLSWTRPCASLRLARETSAELDLRVLGNPTTADRVELELRGAEGQAVRLQVVESNGRTVSDTQIEQAGAVERRSLTLGKSAGVYLIKASTTDRAKTVRVLKQ